MTLDYLASQLHNLSFGGYFNGERFSVDELRDYIARSFRPEVHLAIPNTLVMEIALPDGRWFFTVTRFAKTRDGFDYCIPDDREQESRLKALLVGG